MFKRLTAIALLCAMSAFTVACGGGDTTAAPSDTTASGDTTAAETTAAETEAVIDPELPEKDYEGYKFRFLAQEPQHKYAWWMVEAEEQNGEVLNDAIYERNKMVEEEFNVDLVFNYANPVDTAANTAIIAGDDAFDVTVQYMQKVAPMAQNGYLVNLYDVPCLNLEQDWWDQAMVRDTTVLDQIYCITGDISTHMNIRQTGLVFNKGMCDSLGIDYPYEKVLDGTWTQEYFTKFCQGINTDLNGDGQMDYNDRWGFLSETGLVTTLFITSGGRSVSVNKDGEMELALSDKESINRLTRALEISTDKSTTLWANDYATEKGGWTHVSAWFAEGNALIRSGSLETVPRDYRVMEADFGILPFPKYNEAQEDYITQGYLLGFVFAVPVTCTDTERDGIILEAMAAYSVNTVTKAFYDVCLQGKYIRDDESAAMLDIIFRDKVYDLGYLNNIGSFDSKLRSLESAGNTDPASTIASITPVMETAIAAQMEYYASNK